MEIQLTDDEIQVLLFAAHRTWDWYQSIVHSRQRAADYVGGVPLPLPPALVSACEMLPGLMLRLGWVPPPDVVLTDEDES